MKAGGITGNALIQIPKINHKVAWVQAHKSLLLTLESYNEFKKL